MARFVSGNDQRDRSPVRSLSSEYLGSGSCWLGLRWRRWRDVDRYRRNWGIKSPSPGDELCPGVVRAWCQG
jgi:hypothetical protein